MKYLSKLTSTTCNLEGVDGILTGNQNLYGAATGETWDYYVRVTDEGGFVDSLYAAANGIGDYGNSFLTGIVYAEGGFLTGGTVKAQNVLTQGIGAKGSFGLSVDNTNVITALSSGNVGIGTVSPSYPLHVKSTESALIQIEGTTATNYTAIRYLGTGRTWSQGVGNGSETALGIANKFYLYDSNASAVRFVVDTSGNVGIGTTAPEEKLHVSGSTFISYSGTNANYFGQGNALGYGRIRPFNNSGFLAFDTNYTAGGGYDFAYNGSSVVRINSSGNVGIGTTSPGGKLTVVGDGTEYSNIVFRHGANQEHLIYASTNVQYNLIGSSTPTWIWGQQSASERMRLNNTGLGIGTTSPESKLHINSSVSDGIIVRTTANVEPFIALQRNTGSNGVAVLREFDGGNLYIDTGATGAAQSTKMAITAAGNVGIGTTSPSGQLHVYNGTYQQLLLSYPSTFVTKLEIGANAFIQQDAGNEVLTIEQNYGGGDIAFNAGGSVQRMIIKDNGNVGIGTTSPDQKLHVHKGSAGAVGSNGNTIITAENSTNGYVQILVPDANESGILFGRPTSDADGGILYNSYVSRGLEFRTGGNAVRMVVNSSGNVGIGTTSPGAKLDVNGAQIIQSSAGFGTDLDQAALYISNTNNYGISGNFNGYSRNLIKSNGVGTLTVGRTNTSLIGELTLQSGSSGIITLYAGGSERLRITSSGNVGIGTYSPSSMLTLNGTTPYIRLERGGTPTWEIRQNYPSTEYGFQIVNVTNSNIPFFIGESSNVGIGTTSPASYYSTKLVVSVGDEDGITIAGSGDNYLMFADGTTGADRYRGFIQYSHTADYMAFATDASERMRITSGGNVSIGTTTDAGYKLRVNGTSFFDGLAWFGQNSANGSAFRWGELGTAVSTDTMLAMNQLWNGSGWTILNSAIGTSYLNLGGAVASPDIAFGTGAANTVATPKMIIKNSGNVGIGTTSPNSKLHVVGPSLTINDENTYGLWISETGDDTKAIILGYDQGIDAGIITAVDKAVTWKNIVLQPNAGNVGIGTSSPIYKLQVAGSTYVNGGTLFIDSGNFLMWGNSAQGIRGVNDTSLEFVAGSSERMRITASGNVGIGTTAPSYNLQVTGASTATIGIISNNEGKSYLRMHTNTNEGVYFEADDGSTNHLYIRNAGDNAYLMAIDRSNGNVGIGTSSPAYKLQVKDTSAAMSDGDQVFSVGNTTGGTQLAFGSLENSYNWIRSYESGAGGRDFVLGTNAEVMRLTAAGNVGIGTTSPNAKLAIKDGSNADLEFFSESSGTALQSYNRTTSTWGYLRFLAGGGEKMRIHTDGNVGIGTTSPGKTLSVVGAPYEPISWQRTSGTTGYLYSDSGGVGMYTGTSFSQAGIYMIANTSMDFRVNGAQRMYINSSGNVGIGTASPGSPLDVLGKVSINSDGTLNWGNAKDYGRLTWDTGKAIVRGQSGKALSLGANGTQDYLYINTSGNVGIGTTSPADKLEVAGNISIGGSYKLYNGSASDSAGITFPGSTTRIDGFYGITFHASSTNVGGQSERMRITASGNVGIGTTSPSAKLHVKGNAVDNVGLTVIENDYASGTIYFPALSTINTRGNHSYGIVAEFRTNTSGDSDRPSILFYGEQASHSWQIGQTTSASGWGAGDDFAIGYRASNDPTTFSNWPTAYLIVKTSGNVGIGTTSPAQKLEVNGGSSYPDIRISATGLTSRYMELGMDSAVQHSIGAFGAGTYLTFKTVGTDRMVIDTTGNVGIGTTSPSYALDIERTTGEVAIQLQARDDSSNTAIYFGDNSDADVGSLIYNQGSNYMSFTTNAGERMRITSNGNVGIGTTSPSTLLHLSAANPEIRITDTSNTNYNSIRNVDGNFWIEADKGNELGNSRIRFTVDSTEYMTINTGGNVGIGTTSPTEKLEVQNGTAGAKIKVSNSVGGYASLECSSNATSVAQLSFTNQLSLIGGNVGIGTTAPGSQLHVSSSSTSSTSILVGNTSTGSSRIYFDAQNGDFAGNDYGYIGQADSGYMEYNVGTSSPAPYHVFSNGNVGIGTTSPSSKLQLGEDASTLGSNVFTMYRGGSTGQYTTIENQGGTVYKSHGVGGHAFYHDPAQEAMRVAATTGNLLVGTSTDAGYRLDVQGGDARFAQNVDAASYSVAGNPGWSGTVNFPTNPPGQQNLQFANGILVNVF